MTTTDIVVADDSPLAKPLEIQPLLEARIGELGNLLSGTEVSPERFIASTVHALARFPDVMKASRTSILLAVLEAAEMGLEPTGPYGGAYLIRYKDHVQLIVDYRGFVKMALRSGQVSTVAAALVYEGDFFEYELGTTPFVRHVPTLDRNETSHVRHVYAIFWTPTGGSGFVVMTHAEIEAIRSRSRAGSSGPWVSDWGEMAKKTAVRRLFKLYPVALTPQMAAALDREDRYEDATPVGEAPTGVLTRRARLVNRLAGAETATLSESESEGTAGETNGAADESAGAVTPEAEIDDGLPAMKAPE